ncbi:alpha-protein kinase 1 [Acipenser oxyrinchus oxyrinchus]|uniref:Alpha-protein kinase 1 n=1 Tax=Acipenser oxyrinchus oxyrinchus TaxID=40147 RepID=A0AAD8GKL0_ACIOX|nr:alpha-protein kinase 1 [Acipenser oxyrinchus oxyrinchus]
MNNQGVVAMLEKCRQAAAAGPTEPTEEEKREHERCRASLSADLRTLLEEAKEMKWPFVPERWQYKQDVCPEDKTNLKDIISGRLHELLVYLKASILVGDSATASSIVFLIDRFLYWVDASRKLLQIAKALHKHSPATPIAPQVVIRQARISVNSGKLQKAEYILSSLINNSGATGCWVYHQESDKILVQAVSIQIRGQILQKLGMWYEAAELIWASLVGFNALPQPDKKGLGTSLGVLAGILMSMTDEEFKKFKGSPQIDLSFLEECSHRLLSAAEAAKLALVFSQFTPLFVLSSVIIRGTCLLSYSFSAECPPEKKTLFLTEAKEAFEIGLLTKKDDMIVTSKQELHLLVKAAFSLTVTHRWLGEKEETVKEAKAMCKKAMEKLYVYALADSKGKERLAQEIMEVVWDVKSILEVKDFVNSDENSYVPDSYKRSAERSVLYFKVSFEDVLKSYSQYHTAICEAFETSCGHPKNGNEMVAGACITAMKTETKNLDTECDTETGSPSNSQVVTDEAGKKRKEFSRKARSTQSSELNDKRKSLSDSQSSGSLKSWCRFSETGSSSGWEDLGKDVDNTLHIERRETDLDTQCSTDFGDEANISDYDSLGIQKMSLQVDHIVDNQPTSGAASASAPHVTCSSLSSDNANPLKGLEVDPLMETAESTDDEECTGKAHKCTTSHKASSNSGKPYMRNVPFSSEESRSFELVEGFENETTNDVVVENATSSTGLNPPSASVAFERPAPKIDDVDTEEETAANVPAGRPIVGESGFQGTDSKYLNSLNARTGHSSTEVRLETSLSTDESNSFEFLETEVDEDEDVSLAQEKSQHSYPNKLSSIPNNSMKDNPLHKSGSMEVVDNPNEDRKESGKNAEKQGFFDEDTEEGEVDHVAQILNSSHSSNSSLRSWSRISHFSSSLPEDESLSFLNSSGESWIIEKRTLKAEDYEKLLSGVNHSWLLERLKNTGVFEPKHFKDVYSAILLKYSKISGLWTAQETEVYIGASLGQKGKQRSVFWVQFLHQEETLGRYVGKEYQSAKEVFYHLNDVERQMTAQYYVTEFNKRLYEKQISTQIYFVPSEVLLIMEDNVIKGCISVEPYMLGEFVKLTNNTKTVMRNYKATEYGLAFGHFTYEFSSHKEVVVDLQGWITGNGKGLIYLTDPQIHSLSQTESSNFGQKGIDYFLKDQHGVQCNDICSKLSFARLPG